MFVDDDDVYESGMFALKLDDWEIITYDPAEEPLPPLPSPEALFDRLRSLGDRSIEIPTAARATCGYDAFGQVVVRFEFMVADGAGSPFYGFCPELFVHHDRFGHRVRLINNPPDHTLVALREWPDGAYFEDAFSDEDAPTVSFGDAEEAFHAIMAHVSDAVHILPLTPLLIARLNSLPLSPKDELDERIREHGLRDCGSGTAVARRGCSSTPALAPGGRRAAELTGAVGGRLDVGDRRPADARIGAVERRHVAGTLLATAHGGGLRRDAALQHPRRPLRGTDVPRRAGAAARVAGIAICAHPTAVVSFGSRIAWEAI